MKIFDDSQVSNDVFQIWMLNFVLSTFPGLSSLLNWCLYSLAWPHLTLTYLMSSQDDCVTSLIPVPGTAFYSSYQTVQEMFESLERVIMMEKPVDCLLLFTICTFMSLLDNGCTSAGRKLKTAYHCLLNFLCDYLSLVINRALVHKTYFCMAFSKTEENLHHNRWTLFVEI